MPLGFTFLMCSERSGSNLVARMFDAHADCCGPSPTHLVRILAENRGRYGDLADDGAWGDLCRDAADLLATAVAPARRSWTADELAAATPRRSLASLVRSVFAAEAKAAGKSHLFIKENGLYRYLPFVQRAFPGAKVVAMVRDPRDMALSWKRSAVLRGGVVRASAIWRADQDGLLHTAGYLARGRDLHVIRYEDLVAAPESTLREVCAFLGLPYDPAMLAFHAGEGAAAQAAASETWRNLDRPLMRDNCGKWRRGLAAAEASWVEAVCGDLMPLFGYGPETGVTEDDRERLEARLLAAEPWDKPAWADVPAVERDLRRRRAEVVARIAVRPLCAVVSGEPVHA